MLLRRYWDLQPANVVLSITGGALDFVLSPMLRTAFSHGLAKAAHASSALVVTGGTNSGVMRLTGRSLEEFDAHVQCLGICSWGAINARSQLSGVQDLDKVVPIERTAPNSKNGVNIEPNHTHFLLVDNQKELGRDKDKVYAAIHPPTSLPHPSLFTRAR